MRARSAAMVAGSVLALCSVAWSGILIKGKVVSSLGFPIGAATVRLSDGGSAQTDVDGRFTISSTASSSRQAVPQTGRVAFSGPGIELNNLAGHRVALSVIDALGKGGEIFPAQVLTSNVKTVRVDERRPLVSGTYVLTVSIDGNEYATRFTVVGRHVGWPRATLAEAVSHRLAKTAAAHAVSAQASGFVDGSFTVPTDTAFGIVLTLRQSGLPAATPVTVTEATLSNNFVLRKQNGGGTYNWFWGRVYAWSDATAGSTVARQHKVVYLENRFIKLTVSPELGMRVLRAEDKVTGTVKDLFSVFSTYCQGWPPGNNTGGVKPSFPFYENASPIIDDNGDFIGKAGYFIQSNPDGSVSVVMNGRYDHHQKQGDMGFIGRYGDRPLSTVVTLRPDDASFRIRYVADNPNPLRRSNRIWSDAIVPTKTKMEWLFPAKYEVSHGAVRISDYQANGFDLTFSSRSHFALYPQYPFAGVYYPDEGVNLVRAGDPVKYPGTKVYDNNDPVKELWGSTNVVFEAPDTFVEAFEPVDLEHSYYLTRGIGKVTYANDYLAVGVSGQSFKLITTTPAYIDVYDYGQSGARITQNAFSDPATVVSGSFTKGLRVTAGGKEICNVAIPLTYVDNKSRFNALTQRARLSGGWSCYTGAPGPPVNRTDLDARWGYNYELEGCQNKSAMMNSLAALIAAGNVTSSDPSGVLLSIANTAYRHGGFAAVNTILGKLGSNQQQGANYLRALMAWELGQSPDFSSTVIEGRYFLALQKIKTNDIAGAIADLSALISARPTVIRPRLVRAYLKKDISEVLECLHVNPGSVEAYAVLKELGYSGAAARLSGLLQQHTMATVRMNDFLAEIKGGAWRHERRFEYAPEMFRTWASAGQQMSPSPLPAFPSSLKYNVN